MKGVMRFGKKDKLSPRYISPFKVIKQVRAVAYDLVLLPQFASSYPVFDVLFLRKYVLDPTYFGSTVS